MHRFIPVLLLAALLAACGGQRYTDREQVSPESRVVIKFSHVVAENTPKGLAARRFANALKERTGGRVEVQVFPNAQLYTDGEEMVAIKAGEVQMIAPSLSKLAELDPVWQVFDLPYLFTDLAAAERLIAGRTGERLYGGLRRSGLEPLALWHSGFKQMTNNRRPLLNSADLRGLRFRIQPSAPMRDAFQTLGAEVSVLPFDSVYSAIADGVLDGQENTHTNIYSKRLHELQSYMTLTNHGYLGYVVMINRRFLESLSPDLRETIREVMAETTQWVRESVPRLNEEALERIRTSGRLKIHSQTGMEQAEWRAALEPVYRRVEERIGIDAMRDAQRDLRGE